MTTLEEVKKGMGVTGSALDDQIQVHFDATIAYLRAGGAKDANIYTGLVVRGVLDLWNNGSGDGKFSQAFTLMANQASLRR